MTKKIINLTLSLIIASLSFVNLAQAGDRATLQVSCVIPAIPGVNAPMIADEREENTGETAIVKADSKDSKPQQAQILIQTETKEERTASLVKTYYER